VAAEAAGTRAATVAAALQEVKTATEEAAVDAARVGTTAREGAR